MRTRGTWTRETCPIDAASNLRFKTPAERDRFARIGGVTAHQLGRAHEWTPLTAREAGRKGGLASAARRAKAPEGRPS